MSYKILAITAILLSIGHLASAQDVENSKDHAIISRYPNAKIISYYERDYNEIKFAVKPSMAEQAPKNFIESKGKHVSIVYELPEGKTTIEAMKNYKDAIQEKGGQILFACSSGQCDGTDAWYNAKFFNSIYASNERAGGGVSHYEYFDAYHQSQKYLVAKITTAEKVYYLEIGMTPKYDDHTVKICLEIMEQEALESGLIKVNADLIKEKMDKNGKIELYGIYFDTGKAIIKESSMPELNEVLKYLNDNPGVNIYIVGHTDDTGSLSTNLKLSAERASSVLRYLESKGISIARIDAHGVASFAPVSTNETTEGKQLNRRVEIVKRIK